MDPNCSNSNAYVATSLVNNFHAIPHVDIDLNDISSDFRLDINYFEAVVIWACIPILIIICLFILTTVYLICVCCCCCCQQHEKRSRGSKVTCGVLLSLLVFLILGMIGVAFWAEYALNQSITAAAASAGSASSSIEELETASTAYIQNTTDRFLTELRAAIDSDGSNATALAAVTTLDMATPVLGAEFAEIASQVDVQTPSTVVDAVDFVELVRHWVVIAYLIVVAILLLLFAITIWCGCCCKNMVLVILMVIVMFFVTFVMWVAVGANLALQVVSADICFDPDALIRNLTTDPTSPADSLVPPNVLDYYLICNETCSESPYENSVNISMLALDVIMDQQDVLLEYTMSNPVSADTLAAFANLSSELSVAFNSFDTIVNFTMCEGFNADYLSVLDNLCGNGYLYSVVLFAMACGSAVCLFLLVLCGTFYAGLLSVGKEYDDETVVYDFPGGQGNSTWESYGTQGHFQTGGAPQTTQYTPYRESFNMNTSPTGVNEPPKYGELQHGFNTGDGAAEEQPLPSDQQRPNSGTYDHFDT